MKDVVQSFLATLAIQAFNLLSGILLARALLPGGRGELAAVMLWPAMVAALGIMGIHQAVTFLASRRAYDRGTILASGVVVSLALTIVLLPVGLAVVDLALAHQRAGVRAAAHLYLLFLPLNFLSLVVIGVFQGALRFFEWNLLRSSVHGFYTLFVLVLFATGRSGIGEFALASLAANLATLIAAACLAARRGWVASPKRAALTDILSYGWKVHLGTTVNSVSERLDQLAISVFFEPKALGLFVVATTVARLAAVPAQTLSTLVFPKVAQATRAEDRAAIFGRYLRAGTASAAAAVIAVYLFAGLILRVLFGPAFVSAGGLVQILACASVLLAVKVVMASGLMGLAKPYVIARAEVVGLLASAAGLAALLPPLGVTGAALAAVIAQAGSVAVMATGLRQALGTSLAALLAPRADDFLRVRDGLRHLAGARGR